jgi:hypothetical protein
MLLVVVFLLRVIDWATKAWRDRGKSPVHLDADGHRMRRGMFEAELQRQREDPRRFWLQFDNAFRPKRATKALTN